MTKLQELNIIPFTHFFLRSSLEPSYTDKEMSATGSGPY